MSKIEDIFKKSLENAEAPYDAKAWDSMASRLDQVMPTTAPKGSFKWAWIAGVVLVAGSTGLFFVNQNQDAKAETALANNQTENTTEEATNASETIRLNSSERTADKTNQEEISTVENKSTPEKQTDVAVKDQKVQSNNNNNNPEKTQGSEVLVKVPSEAATEKVQKNPVPVKAPKVTTTVPVETHVNTEVIGTKLDFTVNNERYYEKGLPINSVGSNVEAKTYTWTNERNEVLSTDKTTEIHLFTAGLHNITLTVEHFNGEKQSVTKAIRCDVNYNLLAVTGFNPSSSDYRNSTFIPYALLKSERNIPFDMQVIDPKSGQVIFESKNADTPWDGIDSRTNQLVPVNATYIWRVNIHEKAIGEPTNSYQGTITRI